MSLSLLLPAMVFMGLLLWAQYQSSRARFEEQLLEQARTLSLATDAELDRMRGVVDSLSVSRTLQTGAFAAFEAEARRVASGPDGWIVLMDDREQQVVNTLVRPGAPLPRGGFPAEAWGDLRQGRTRISNLTTGLLAKRPVIAVDRPVVVGDRLYVLSYLQPASEFQPLVGPEVVRGKRLAAIIDGRSRIVARSLAPERTVGREATRDFQTALTRSNRGILRSRNLEGVPTLVAYTRSPSSGWAFSIGVPRRDLQVAALRSVLVALAAFAALIAIGLFSARLFARPLSQDLSELAEAARTLGLPDARPTGRARIAETAQVRAMMTATAEELERRRNEEAASAARQQTLIHELNHRVKNTLATVQSLAMQSFRRDGAEGVGAFNERLLALSRAHNLLTETAWASTDLAEVARAVLEPYDGRARWSGPAVDVDAQASVSLTMVLHELATNAAKYGALAGDGWVELAWRLDGGELDIAWIEQGGPPAAEPEREGFGSRLIRATIERELKGSVETRFAPGGLSCVLRVPLSARIAARP